MEDYDVVIAGGSISGLMSAREIAKKRIPFFLVFTGKILNFHVISDCYQCHKSFKSPVILSIFSSGAGPIDIQVIVPGAICV